MQEKESFKILIVDDEIDILELVEFNLLKQGFRTLTAQDGEQALRLARKEKPDAIILDLMLPGINGLDVCRILKSDAATKDVPIIMLTARGEEEDIVKGLEMGADDYVTKPFSARELAARVRAVLRRMHRPAGHNSNVLRAGKIMVNTEELRVEYDGKPLSVSRRELKLLACLLRHPARIYTRDVLIDLIYDGDALVTDRTVDAQVKRIRHKFSELDSGFDPIQTVYGMGYKLKAG